MGSALATQPGGQHTYAPVPGAVLPDADEQDTDLWDEPRDVLGDRNPAQECRLPESWRQHQGLVVASCRREGEEAALLPQDGDDLAMSACSLDAPAAQPRSPRRMALMIVSCFVAIAAAALMLFEREPIIFSANSFLDILGQENTRSRGIGAPSSEHPANQASGAGHGSEAAQSLKALSTSEVSPAMSRERRPLEFDKVFRTSATLPEMADLRRAMDVEGTQPAAIGDQSVESVVFEAVTSSRAGAGCDTGAQVSFFCGGAWTPPRKLFSRVAAGEAVRLNVGSLPQWPSKLKLSADGADPWGFKRVALTTGDTPHTILNSTDGEAFGSNQFWIAALHQARRSQEYSVPALATPPSRCSDGACTLSVKDAKPSACEDRQGKAGDTCSKNVMWAMSHGIWEHPEWYPGLSATSSFEQFQAILHMQGHGGCPRPCNFVASYHRGVPGSSIDGPGTSGGRRELTFYVYRLQGQNSTEPAQNVNVMDLATAMAKLHARVGDWSGDIAPHLLSTRIQRLRLTTKTTWSFFEAHRRQFGPYVEFDSRSRCVNPECDRVWKEFGFPVGCQLRSLDGTAYGTPSHGDASGVAVQATAAQFSLPGPCPSGRCRSGADAAQVPGGSCNTVTGAPDCTYHVEEAGSVGLDELMGVADDHSFLEGCRRIYDPMLDKGMGCSFWDGRANPRQCETRLSRLKSVFKSKFPKLPDCDALAAPPCDVGPELEGKLSRLMLPEPTEKAHSQAPLQRVLPVVKPYACSSGLRGLPMVASAQKGLTLDDTTFLNCPQLIPQHWPHTGETVRALRLFKSWDPAWDDVDREGAWSNIVDYVASNRAKVLMGTQLTCNESDDDRDWNLTVQLMKRIGPDLVMGVSFGNELELLQFKEWVTPDCARSLWDLRHGYVIRKLKERVRSLDGLPGFAGMPVTTVLTGMALNGDPFYEVPSARIQTLLSTVTAHLGRRWVFSFNFYPYFDPTSQLDHGSSDQCQETIRRARCFNAVGCSTIEAVAAARAKMQRLTGEADWPLWISELGWSWPMSSTLNTAMSNCPSFSSEAMFRAYYEGFLSWDLRVTLDALPPDMVFYFTMRDSDNAGYTEHFGLIGKCTDSQCKMEVNETRVATE